MKDSSLLMNITKNIEFFKKSNERFLVNRENPSYEISVKRNDLKTIDYFVILLRNQKNIMFDFIFHI